MKALASIICLLVIILSSCSKPGLSEERTNRLFKYLDPGMNAYVLSKLSEQGIDYVFDDRGMVVTMLTDQARINLILSEAQDSYYDEPDGPYPYGGMVPLVNQAMRQAYEKGFIEAGIEYEVLNANGTNIFMWLEEDNLRAVVLAQHIEEALPDDVYKKILEY